MISKTLKLLLAGSILSISGIANAIVYEATNAESDQWHGAFGTANAHNHALWFPGLLAANDWLIDPANPGIFDYNEIAGTAAFTGTVSNEGDPGSTGNFEFNFVRSDSGNTPKKELIDEAYDPAPPGGGITDPLNDWTFFDFASPGTFTGTGGLVDGLVFELTQRGSGGVRGQFGEGANGKNITLGFSAWFFWSLVPPTVPNALVAATTTCPGSILNCSGHGDINIDLNPVPVPAAFWLFGTALVGFIGFSRRRSIL